MAASHELTRPPIVSDACCIFNLLHSGYGDDIFRYFKTNLYTSLDAQTSLRNGVLDTLIAAGDLNLTDLKSNKEYSSYVSLAHAGFHNSEAACIAIAVHRKWAIATDEQPVYRFCQENGFLIPLITTLDLVKDWADGIALQRADIKKMLAAIQQDAGYYPAKSHVLYEWWKEHA